ncbi:MAG: hypothetical protein HY298_20435 [Verrucomicrobia bacterium]|nr:hypothetical protein [Verrucomicrobiota bacterium]
MKAGLALTGGASGYGYMTREELRVVVTKDAAPLELVRIGLTKECRVPIEYSVNYLWSHAPERAAIRHLAFTLLADGELAEMEGRNSEAARAYLQCVQLGQETSRGGVWTDKLVGIACEAFGSTPLQNLLTNLTARECRDVIQSLETIEKHRESFGDIMEHERDFSRRVFPFYQRVVGSILRFFNFVGIKQAEQKAFQKFQTQDRRRRELLIDVASRAYELEKGRRPKSIAELVPDYLRAIPKDPLTGTNMIYTP